MHHFEQNHPEHTGQKWVTRLAVLLATAISIAAWGAWAGWDDRALAFAAGAVAFAGGALFITLGVSAISIERRRGRLSRDFRGRFLP